MKVLLFFLTCLPLFGENHTKLIARVKKWEVPQPHPESRLCKIWAYYNSSGEYYTLGFIEPGKPKKALVGSESRDISVKTSHPPIMVKDIDQLKLDFIVASSPFGSPNGTNNGLLTAIQLIRKGHAEIGGKLLEKSLKSDAGHSRSPLHIKENQSVELMLAQSCLAAASNAITTPNPDFADIKRRIETLVVDQPSLKNKTTDWLLSALKASVEHPKPKPDTLEALIDDYLMSGATEGAVMGHRRTNPAREALVAKGFEVIPALIEQLDDKRMTNHLMQGFNNFSSYPMTTDLVINAYLQSFANDEMGSNWLRRQQGYTSGKEAVLAWWKKASAIGEKDYVRQHTVRKAEKSEVELSSDLLAISKLRYPDLIPGFYAQVLRSKTYSHEVAEALGGHPEIALETRKKLLLKAISGGREEHRNSALWVLFDLDREKAESLVLALIKKGPRTTQGKYWTDQNASLSQFVSKSANLDLWNAVEKYIERGLLGMRMELISNLRPPADAPKEVLKTFLRIFDRYGRDQTLRKNSTSKKFDGPGAGFPYDDLELRNFIHIHFGRWLEVEERPPDRKEQTPGKWSVFRGAVYRAMSDFRTKHGLVEE